MNTNSKTRELTFLGVMFALTIVFVVLTAVPGTGATMAFFMFIPTIVTSIVYGPKYGAVMGALAGLTTLARAYLAPLSPFDYFFQNPVIAVLPRIFIGVVPYFVYVLFKKLFTFDKTEALSIAIAGASGAVINTILVVTALYLVYGQKIMADYGVANSLFAFFVAIAGINGFVEAGAAAILTTPVVKIYRKVSR